MLSELGILIPRNIAARNCIVLDDFEQAGSLAERHLQTFGKSNRSTN